jgi:D-aminoacyl-tRNA deacylase
MRLVIQRVKEASVSVAGRTVGSIGRGLVVLVGFGREDRDDLHASPAWRKVLDKTVNLRLFPDEQGRTNLSLEHAGGEILLVSQFTLYADVRRGRRPGFEGAAEPELARRLYERFACDLKALRPGLQAGVFGAEMELGLVNWGPLTLIIDTGEL